MKKYKERKKGKTLTDTSTTPGEKIKIRKKKKIRTPVFFKFWKISGLQIYFTDVENPF